MPRSGGTSTSPSMAPFSIQAEPFLAGAGMRSVQSMVLWYHPLVGSRQGLCFQVPGLKFKFRAYVLVAGSSLGLRSRPKLTLAP